MASDPLLSVLFCNSWREAKICRHRDLIFF